MTEGALKYLRSGCLSLILARAVLFAFLSYLVVNISLSNTTSATENKIPNKVSNKTPEEIPEKIPEKIKVTVGEWPPFLTQELEGNGVIGEMIVDIFASQGIHADLAFLPWGRGYHEASSGGFQAMGIWMHKQEREKDFLYSDPILKEQFVFFHRKDLDFDWDEMTDLKEYRLGGGIKYSYGPELDAAVSGGTLFMDRGPSDEVNFHKLLTDRIQIYPQEKSVGYFALMNHFSAEDQDQITHHPKPILNNLSYVLFPKVLEGSADLMDRFNKGLKEFRESGAYDRYMKRLTDDEMS
ncbi:ABC transporter substrate-binding protein [Kiloniella sp. EL199]|uniref:substrate-binding periplasmic protein n=1 Tax=Kiloniella sp. EL199 TaxID=2107581 RepID=UPI000EA173CC|nr:transporter substrate-binding domain-containing protein [Kiloniella sp. EL199]